MTDFLLAAAPWFFGVAACLVVAGFSAFWLLEWWATRADRIQAEDEANQVEQEQLQEEIIQSLCQLADLTGDFAMWEFQVSYDRTDELEA